LLNTIASLHLEWQMLRQVCCGDTTARKKISIKKPMNFMGFHGFLDAFTD
jgi:hypothetical protein